MFLTNHQTTWCRNTKDHAPRTSHVTDYKLQSHTWRVDVLGWVHTCNVTAYRNTVSWQCGRDWWPRNVSKVGYAVTLRACSVCCRYLAVASKEWYGYGRSRCGRATCHTPNFDTLRGHESRPHCHNTVLRCAVTLQVCTHPNKELPDSPDKRCLAGTVVATRFQCTGGLLECSLWVEPLCQDRLWTCTTLPVQALNLQEVSCLNRSKTIRVSVFLNCFGTSILSDQLFRTSVTGPEESGWDQLTGKSALRHPPTNPQVIINPAKLGLSLCEPHCSSPLCNNILLQLFHISCAFKNWLRFIAKKNFNAFYVSEGCATCLLLVCHMLL